MPYISPRDRKCLDPFIEALAVELGYQDKLDGAVEYVLYKLILKLYPKNFTSLNCAVGILETTKLNLYRQVLGKYEDLKRAENGIPEEDL